MLLAKTGDTDNSYMYVGEEYNANTGLYYLRARYMNPSTGSFTTMDSYQGSLYEPISLHKYAYANANPVSYVDPSGYTATSLSECTIVETVRTNINEIVQIQSLKRVMNWANAACTAYDVITLTMSAMLDDAELGYIIFSICKGVAIGMLINCILASTSSFVLKAIFATKGIKDQHELIMDAIEEGNPWLVALRIMQMFTIIFGIAAQCFTGETLVVTDEGLVAIEDIEVGDYVLAEDTETGEKEYKEVLNVYVSQTNKLVHVTTADDNSETIINTTDNHPFYVEGKGWVPAIELEAGDVLKTADGSIEVVSNVEVDYLDESVLIYNLEIEGYHTYFVSDENVLVHNTKKCGPNNKNDDNLEVDEAIDKLPNNVKQYGACDKFALKLAESLNIKKLKFKIIKVKSDFGIYSDKAEMIIGYDYHYGIQVGNTVYNNITIKGMPFDDWLNDLGLTGEFDSLRWEYVDDIFD